MNSEIKKLVLSKTKKAISDLQESDTYGAQTLFNRLVAAQDFAYDETWEKEFSLSAVIFGALGTSIDSEIKEMSKEKKERIINLFIKTLNEFYEALEKENVQTIDNVLKDCARIFIDEFAH